MFTDLRTIFKKFVVFTASTTFKRNGPYQIEIYSTGKARKDVKQLLEVLRPYLIFQYFPNSKVLGFRVGKVET